MFGTDAPDLDALYSPPSEMIQKAVLDRLIRDAGFTPARRRQDYSIIASADANALAVAAA